MDRIHRMSRGRKTLLSLLMVGTIGTVAGIGTFSAFSATTVNTGNVFAAGTVSISDNDAGAAMYTIVNATPLNPVVRCIEVTYDDGGNPPAGVGTVTADVSAFSTGGTAVAMTAGAFTVQGVPYNYRSAARTAINPMANGTRTYAITMADLAVPLQSQSQTGFTVVIDNTTPAPVNMTSTNGAGGTIGRPEPGDSITYTWNEPIDPESLLPGWDGGSPTTVTVRLANNGAGDQIRIRGVSGSLNFGIVFLQQNYVSGAADFTASASGWSETQSRSCWELRVAT